MRKNKWKYVLFLALFLNYFYGFSQTTIITNGDTYTWDSKEEFNYRGERLVISKDDDDNDTGHTREVYVRFNLSTLTTVTSAKLRLTLESSTLSPIRTYDVYKVPNFWKSVGVNGFTWDIVKDITPADLIASGTHVGDLIEFDITSAILTAVTNSETSITIKIVSNQEDLVSLIYSLETASSDAVRPRLVINETTLSLIDEVNSEINNIVVYPNPTANNLYVKGLTNEETTISVYNSLGQLLKNEKFKSSIYLSALKTGLYYVKILNTQGVKTFSVLKE